MKKDEGNEIASEKPQKLTILKILARFSKKILYDIVSGTFNKIYWTSKKVIK